MSPPQAVHLPWLPHRFPAAHVDPEQHAWPAPPQSPQVPAAEQVVPLVQRGPGQQSWPTPPHAAQVPTAQTESPVQASPAQHGRPAVPQTTGMLSPGASPVAASAG
jgi:hypothetical protein